MKIELTQREQKPALRIERWFAHPPEKVWEAITQPEELKHWFPAAMEGERAVGSALAFRFEGDTPLTHGKVTAWEPPSLFEYTWEEDVLRFELRRDGDGCLMIFTNVLADRATAVGTAAGWHVCLDMLGGRLDGRKPETPPQSELLARYGASLGIGAFPSFIKTGEAGSEAQRVVFRHATEDTEYPERLQATGEYVAVLEGTLTLRMNGSEISLKAGSEFFIHPGILVAARAAAGTRSIHATPAGAA